MKNITRHLLPIALLLSLSATPVCEASTSFADMSADEITALLARDDAMKNAPSVSAKDTVTDSGLVLLPVSVSAADLISKVYGIASPTLSKEECIREAQTRLGLTPSDDNGTIWLESESGYGVEYYGMLPAVSAMARYDGGNADGIKDGAADFGYFFLFPYSGSGKREAIRDQTDFCGSLLQEMADIGLPMDLNTATDDLFEAVGQYDKSLVVVRLLDDSSGERDGRFILILSIEPDAFSPADDIMAESLQ